MVKKSKKAKSRLDKYYYLARQHGFRARSAFKLVQLNKKYNFLQNCHTLVDLCAAPGGWMQVAAKYMPLGSTIIGVDLCPIKPIKGCIALKDDITTQHCRQALRRELKGQKCDAVIHDGAPNVGGQWCKDAYSQSELTLHATKLAAEMLRPGGIYITKIFRSQDYHALLWVMNKLFKKVEAAKPQASRSTSAEIYAVCHGYLAPDKIDPRFFDPAAVFKQFEIESTGGKDSKVADITGEKAGKRHRGGYDEEYLKKMQPESISRFIETTKPVEFLGSCGQLNFDEDSQVFLAHSATTEEIKALCADLRVLSKADFKTLLKWRYKMLQYKKELKKAQGEESESEEEETVVPQKTAEDKAAEEEAKLIEEMEGVDKKLAARQKKQQKKLREKKQKQQKRMGALGDAPETADEGLFSLSTIRTKEGLDAVEEADLDTIPEDYEKEDELEALHEEHELPDGEDKGEDVYDSDFDSDSERYGDMEADLDAAYSEYRKRKNLRSVQDERAAKKSAGLPEEEEDSEAIGKLASDGKQRADEGEEEMSNPLVMQVDAPSTSAKQRAARWFAKDVFAGLEEDGKKEEKKDTKAEKKSAKNQNKQASVESDSEKEDDESEGDAEVSDIEAGDISDEEGGDISEEEAGDISDEEGSEKSADEDEKPSKRRKTAAQAQPQVDPNSRLGKRLAKHEKRWEKEQKMEEDGPEDRLSELARSIGEKAEAADQSGKPAKKKEAKQEDGEEKDEEEEEVDEDEVASAPKASEDVDFQEVAAEEWSSDSEAEAETLAIGSQFLKKKRKNDIADDSYNRFAFLDDGPDWFKQDEERHNKPIMPVTRQMVDVFKQQLAAINARPIKKIAEAKARKKMKAVKKWEALKEKAQAIAEQDAPNKSKLSAIQALYKKSNKKGKTDRVYVVSKKGGGASTTDVKKKKGQRIKLVDKRMKKDNRAAKNAMKKKGGKKRPRS